MKNILEDLYFGNIVPNENLWTRDAEYQRFAKASVKLEREIGESLSGEVEKQFDAFVDAIGNMHAMEAQLRFAAGFRLGARILLDVLAEDVT